MELRTFIIKNMKFSDKCIEIKELKYNHQGISFVINESKDMPVRDSLAIALEQEVIKYNQN